jgi:hypothetical protein
MNIEKPKKLTFFQKKYITERLMSYIVKCLQNEMYMISVVFHN